MSRTVAGLREVVGLKVIVGGVGVGMKVDIGLRVIVGFVMIAGSAVVLCGGMALLWELTSYIAKECSCFVSSMRDCSRKVFTSSIAARVISTVLCQIEPSICWCIQAPVR